MNILKRLGIIPTKIRFFNIEGKEIEYKKYIKSENMLVIETETGLQKIPADGLVKIEE